MSQKRTTLMIAAGVGVVILLVLAVKSMFVVRVDQFAIVTEFGKPIGEGITEPGLYFVIPFVQEVQFLDKRIRGWDDSQRDTKTNDGRQIDYTVYARWQVSEPLKFYKAVGTEQRAHATMDSIVTNRIQTTIRQSQLASIVRETGRRLDTSMEVDPQNIFDVYEECNPKVNPEFASTLPEVPKPSSPHTDGVVVALRSVVVRDILEASNMELEKDYGITVRDLHFKYLNYSEQVHQDIIRQIRADRLDDISSYLEVGRKCVGYIDRLTDAERGRILGEGENRVRKIDGEGVAQSIQIKAAAFGKAPEFYRFLKMLDLYRAGFKRGTRMVLSTGNPLMDLLDAPDVLNGAIEAGQ